MCAKTAPWAPKLGYFDGRAPQLSARDNHATDCVDQIFFVKLHLDDVLKVLLELWLELKLKFDLNFFLINTMERINEKN